MSSAGRAVSSNGCVTKPKERGIGLTGCAVSIRSSSLTGSYVMETAEHREPYESRGSRTVLGAPGGETPPGDSTCVTSNAGPHGATQNYTRDEGGPFEVDNQVVDLKPPQAAVVKSNGGERCGNAGTRFRQARLREASASEPSMKCRKRISRCQNRGLTLPPGSAWGNPEVCPSGIRHVDGAKLNQALVRNVRTCPPMQREKSQAAKTAKMRVPMRSTETEQLVLGMKAL